MKKFQFLGVVLPLLVVTLVGCKEKAKPAEAPAPTAGQEQAPAVPAPEFKQAIAAVNTGVKTKNYAEATRALDPIVNRGTTLTPQQKEDVRAVYKQITQAIAADPRLDTPEMHALRTKLSKALTSGPRF